MTYLRDSSISRIRTMHPQLIHSGLNIIRMIPNHEPRKLLRLVSEEFLYQSPRVFAVAVTSAKIMIALTSIVVIELEPSDRSRVLIIEDPRP